MKDCVQLWFDNVTCYVNTNTDQVFSAKEKLLKGLRHPHIECPFYIIKYRGYKKTKSLDQLRRMANETLQRKNS